MIFGLHRVISVIEVPPELLLAEDPEMSLLLE